MVTRRWQVALMGLMLSAAWACSDPTSSAPRKEGDAQLAMGEGSAGILAFTAVDLGTAGGLLNSIAEGINTAGIVAGVSYTADPALDGTVTAWNAAGPHNLGVPAGFFAAEGKAINNFGDIVGIAYAAAGRRGFVWTPGGGFSILTGPPGATDVQAFDIDANALVVVGEVTVAGAVHAFRWQPVSGYQDLHPPGYLSSHANAISPNGGMTGWAKTAAGDDHAVMWSPTAVFTDLGTLPGGTTSQGYDINSAGAVVGQSDKLGGNVVAIVRNFPLPMQSGPFANSAGSGVSDMGRMVGWAPLGGARRAATKRSTTAFLFLPTLGATMLSDAREVNLCGHAVGSTTFVNGVVHATRWTNAPCD